MVDLAIIERLSGAEDQKKELQEIVGDLSWMEVLYNKILVGIYIEPEKTAGGLYISTDRKKESVWQGTVGVVLKKGNTAFKDDPHTKSYFDGQDVKIGDWVVFRPGDNRRVQINGVDCRFVEDTAIDLIVERPDKITHR